MMEPKDFTADDNPISFAKVAAMPPEKSQASAAPDDGNASQHAQARVDAKTQSCEGILPGQDRSGNAQCGASANRDVDCLSQAVQSIHLAGRKGRENIDISSDTQQSGGLMRETSFEDDRTHLSNSSTKPTSLDSKSMVSITTFAMDEKESLRPDDSASVQAIDEEESLSGLASGAPNSLTGSESGARGLRDHLREVNPHSSRGILQNHGPVMNDGPGTNGAIPPDSVANNFIVSNQELLQDARSVHGLPHDPDEKLLEAMKSPKDRLLILQLEDKVRHFIQKSNEQSLELPPSNAFGRLLAHKLGDYYHLTHFVDNNVTSVRLHRTPFCRLSTPLSALHAANNDTPPPTMPAMKIMRRKEGERPPTEGSTAASSVPSKTVSEAEDGNDGDHTGSSASATPAQDRLIQTREEREAKYNEVRERIFRDFPESRESRSDNSGDQDDISRSSSTSGRRKTHRQKTPHDDSFEVRSQYNAYYPDMQYTNGPSPYQAAMNDPGLPSQPPFMVGPGATPPGMGYSASSQNSPMYTGHMHGMPQYPIASPQMTPAGPWQGGNIPQQPPFAGYASMGSPAMINQPPSAKSPPVLNNYGMPNTMQYHHPTNWPSSPYHGTYQQSPHRHPPGHWPNYPSQQLGNSPASYPYGQFPGQPPNPGIQGSAHPLPGSFNRSFNPQTRSFVPGGPPPARHPSRGNQHGMNPYQSLPPGPPQWTGFQDASSRNQEPLGYSNYSSYSGRVAPLGNRDSIAKWGTPSHLPPKPPPSEVPLDFAMNRNTSLPGNAYGNAVNSNNGPLVVSGGSSLPKTN